MKTKQLFVILSILGVLAAGVFVKSFIKPAELVQGTDVYAPLDLSFDPAAAGKIVFSRKDASVEIVKEAGEWRVPGFANAHADGRKIDDFFKEFREARGEVRGKSKDLFGDFAISDEEAYQVKILNSAGAEVLAFFVGAKKSGGGYFVRRKDSENVYLTEAEILARAGLYGDPSVGKPEASFWVSTRFVPESSSLINSIEIIRFRGSKQQSALRLKKDGAGWQSEEALPFGISSEKVQAFFASAQGWVGEKAIDPQAKDYGFNAPFWKMRWGLDDGTQHEITVSHPDAYYYVQAPGEPVIFQIPEYMLTTMDVDGAHFAPENPLALNPEKIEKLTVVSNGQTRVFQPKQDKGDTLSAYMNGLRYIQVSRLVRDVGEEKKISGKQRMEILQEGEAAPLVLEFGPVMQVMPAEYAARIQGKTPAFTVSEESYKKIFENLPTQ